MWNMLRLISLFVLLAPAAIAADNPVVFQRDIITFLPVAPPIEVAEEPSETEEDDAEPLPPREPFDLKVEIRPQDALRLEWIHTLNTLEADGGVMIVLNEAMRLPLMPLQVFTPLDVVVVDAQGRISQLIPQVVLAHLGEDIIANRPTRAFVYMQAGAIELYAIEPGDQIDHPYFTPQQTVLQ